MSLFVQLHQPLNLSPLLQDLFNNYFVIAFEFFFFSLQNSIYYVNYYFFYLGIVIYILF